MYGITLDDGKNKIHTFNDWGLFLSSFDIGEAVPKTTYVDITGGDGTLDLTEVYGRVFYKDRTHTIVLSDLDTNLRWEDKLDLIMAYIHGKTFKITADYNKMWYYIGRIEISKYATSKRLGKITLKCVCEPYKYKQYKTIISSEVNESTDVICPNSKMVVTPTFKADSLMDFTYNGVTYPLQKDVETIYEDIQFIEGNNELIFNGNGNVVISYQEGTL